MNSIEKFYNTYFTAMQELFSNIAADEYGFTKENYWEKVLSPTNLSDADFEEIESKLNWKLPTTFKEFYKRCYSVEEQFDIGGLQIAGNLKDSPLNELKKFIFEQGISDIILKLGLVPFGFYNDTWYICFNTSQNSTDPPIVLFELDNYSNGKEAISHRNWFTSFSKFLDCITDWILTGNWENFNSIDPDNNFTNAYDYWIK